MPDASWWDVRGVRPLAALLCVVVAAALAAWRYPGALRELHRQADWNSGLSYADREFAGGNGVVVDQEALYQARARISDHESYHVKTGETVEGATDLTIPYVASFATYFLLPRRQAEDAPWVICYGCDHSELPGHVQRVWENGADISIVRLRR